MAAAAASRITAAHALAVAAALLLITTVRHYGYDQFPVEHRAVGSKGLGGAALLAQAWVIYALIPSRLVLPVVLFVADVDFYLALVGYALAAVVGAAAPLGGGPRRQPRHPVPAGLRQPIDGGRRFPPGGMGPRGSR